MEKLQAAAEIRKLARQYEAMVAAADTLEKVGSLEQAQAEGQRKLDLIRASIVEAGKDEVIAKAGLESVRETWRLEREEQKAAMSSMRSEANKAFAEMKAAAEGQAATLKAQAVAEIATADARVRAANTEAALVKAGISERLEAGANALAAKEAELASVEDKINKARSAARALLA